ncbi:MAG: hypothetical protein GY862_16095 [Gammaproteobacteria bacterium]|nr:hypothetical protein [Gammaproteobacteria bacterium]
MKKADIPGAFLPWRDVLHDGPVPEGLPLDELSEVRAQFIIERGWGKPENVKNSFIERDNELKSFHNYGKVILWFEHDLYDQLQVLQILDWFSQISTIKTSLSIICSDQYLGMLSPDEMKGLFMLEEPVTEDHLKLSHKAWTAFRSSTPEKWCDLLNTDTSILPFLKGAIIRLLEEYPCCTNGLSRTAKQALKIISEGEKHPARVFGLYQETEERRFLGDSSFWVILHELLESNPPLLVLPDGKKLTLPASPDQELSITRTGREVLDGKRNWLEMTELDRWIGGVHLTSGNTWCSLPDGVCNPVRNVCTSKFKK